MKEIVEYLNSKNIICKRLKEVKPKSLESRKKIEIFVGIDLKHYYCSFLLIEKKSRVLKKEVAEIIELHNKLEIFEDSKITKRYIRIKAPLCSHAKAMLEENGWRVWMNT